MERLAPIRRFLRRVQAASTVAVSLAPGASWATAWKPGVSKQRAEAPLAEDGSSTRGAWNRGISNSPPVRPPAPERLSSGDSRTIAPGLVF